VWVYFEIANWGGSTVSDDAGRHAAVYGVGIKADGAAIQWCGGRSSQGFTRARYWSGSLPSESASVEDWGASDVQPVSMMCYFDGTGYTGSWTLDKLNLWAAACLSGATIGLSASPYFKIARANISWLAIRSE
jgi:hypothetical protein